MALSQSTFSIYKCYIINCIVKLVTDAAAALSGCMCEIHQGPLFKAGLALILGSNLTHCFSLCTSMHPFFLKLEKRKL